MQDRTLDSLLREKLDEASALLFARDMAVVDMFWAGGGFWLFGSEAEQQDITREDLRAHLERAFSGPYRVRFVFEDVRVDRHNDMAWANADAVMEIHHPDRVTRGPYRLFALFQWIEGEWRWRVFSGSEPAAAP